jgi:hypothetical protein
MVERNCDESSLQILICSRAYRSCISLSSPNSQSIVSSMHPSVEQRVARTAGNLHIDGSQGTVGDGTTDSTSEGESGVEGEAGELLLGLGDGSHWIDVVVR